MIQQVNWRRFRLLQAETGVENLCKENLCKENLYGSFCSRPGVSVCPSGAPLGFCLSTQHLVLSSVCFGTCPIKELLWAEWGGLWRRPRTMK